ncbi:MAG: hypothetical protein ACREPF_11690 [Rhodanobacteraceae bacterium]
MRAAVLYVGAVWALSQGISQLSPAFDLQTDVTRWFVIVCAIGFPFWIACAWFYALTPQGFKREADVDRNPSLTHSTGRKLDFAIIAVLAVAVILLGSGYFIRRGAPAGASTVAAAATPQKSVAVLPFTDDSGNKNRQFSSDGLSEDLITALSQFAGLKVISRDSAFQFRDSEDTSAEIGKALGVAHLLEGSVQRAGDSPEGRQPRSQVWARLRRHLASLGRQIPDRPHDDERAGGDRACASRAPDGVGAGPRVGRRPRRPLRLALFDGFRLVRREGRV